MNLPKLCKTKFKKLLSTLKSLLFIGILPIFFRIFLIFHLTEIKNSTLIAYVLSGFYSN